MKAIIIYTWHDEEINEEFNEGGIYEGITREALTKKYNVKESEICCYIPLTVSGKTYAERKADLQDKAIEWSNNNGLGGDWSYGELATIQEFFETNGKRYGLLKEFRENAII